MIATAANRAAVTRSLKRRGFDTQAAIQDGTLIFLDAAETLSRFMVNGHPDESRLWPMIETLITKANAAARCDTPCATVFGEMVALLWKSGNRTAAIELERLWNDLSRRVAFSLYCGYPMNAFPRQKHAQSFAAICAYHQQVVPAESYSSLTQEAERLRTVARLQQRLQALETELLLNEERVCFLQRAADAGTWEIDLGDDSISLSACAQEMLGIKATGQLFVPDLLNLMRHSRDRESFQAALRKARTGRKEFAATFRIKGRNQVKLLLSEGRTVYNAGRPLMFGTLKETVA
jgi:hypothetical protein